MVSKNLLGVHRLLFQNFTSLRISCHCLVAPKADGRPCFDELRADNVRKRRVVSGMRKCASATLQHLHFATPLMRRATFFQDCSCLADKHHTTKKRTFGTQCCQVVEVHDLEVLPALQQITSVRKPEHRVKQESCPDPGCPHGDAPSAGSGSIRSLRVSSQHS